MIVGIDVGYGYTKVLGTGRFTFPSVIGKATPISYRDNDLSTAERDSTHGRTYTYRGMKWWVGTFAMLQARDQLTSLARERTDTRLLEILYLAALDLVNALGDVYVVTGLPVRWYADKEQIVKLFVGSKAVQVNGIWHKANVRDGIVMPQPYGTLFREVLDRAGVIRDERLARGRVGIIDVGTYTTDFVLADGMRFIQKGSDSIEDAMASVYETTARGILDGHGLELSLHEVDRASRSGHFRVYGRTHEIEPYLSPALEQVWTAIEARAVQLWASGKDLDTILVTGGGGYWFAGRIVDKYPHARQVQGDPGFANVEGFYRYGVRKFTR